MTHISSVRWKRFPFLPSICSIELISLDRMTAVQAACHILSSTGTHSLTHLLTHSTITLSYSPCVITISDNSSLIRRYFHLSHSLSQCESLLLCSTCISEDSRFFFFASLRQTTCYFLLYLITLSHSTPRVSLYLLVSLSFPLLIQSFLRDSVSCSSCSLPHVHRHLSLVFVSCCSCSSSHTFASVGEWACDLCTCDVKLRESC